METRLPKIKSVPIKHPPNEKGKYIEKLIRNEDANRASKFYFKKHILFQNGGFYVTVTV